MHKHGEDVVAPSFPQRCASVSRQVLELANSAYENTTAPEINAESCYLKARVHHAMGSLDEAKLLYTEACNLWPQFPLAQYGMAQMLVYEGNIEPAVKALDAVLAEVPNNQVRCRENMEYLGPARNVPLTFRFSLRQLCLYYSPACTAHPSMQGLTVLSRHAGGSGAARGFVREEQAAPTSPLKVQASAGAEPRSDRCVDRASASEYGIDEVIN